MKKITRTLLATTLAFSLFSCTNILQQSNKSQDKKSSDGETYLVVSTATIKKTSNNRARVGNIKPDADPENLTSLLIKGREISSGETTLAKITEADSISELKKQKIKIDAGTWEFQMSAKLNDITFSSEVISKEIQEGTENTIKFTLTSEVEYGGLEITVEWTEESNKVVATLMDAAESKTIATQTFANFAANERTVTFSRSILDEDERLLSGTYYLKFDFYNETTKEETDVFDFFDSYVNIADGITTQRTISIDLSETFNINYEKNGGSLVEGEFQPLKYSRKSTDLTLPEMKKPGYFWGGWYDNENFEGEPVTKIPAGTGVQKNFYAKWNDPTLYVSDWFAFRGWTDNVAEQTAFVESDNAFISGETGNILGNDDNDGLSPSSPLKTINGACNKIVELGDSEMNWTIYIAGKISGVPAEGVSSMYKDIGRSEIPETVDDTNAKSITIIGARGIDSDGMPQDILDRGITTNSTDSQSTGTALVINTQIPVTIKNLKITGAENDPTTAGSDPYSQKGGGIYISANSTVSLTDGVVLYGNKGYFGGAIYNAGTLYIYGTAIIGIREQTESASQKAANASGSDGGAIYNLGKVYLGYSEYITESNNTPADWSGCMNYNYAWRGGAISNRNTGIVVIRDGTIGHNQTVYGGGSGGGGGIYNYGSVIMTGGTLEYNFEGGNQGGGAIWNGRSSSYGTGIFEFSGGVIKNNIADSGNNGVNGGGGIHNNGIVYIYGDAVIGDEKASEIATESSHSNISAGPGAGIYVAEQGKVYIGYSNYVSASENTPAEWKKGIYYNYSKDGGGGLSFAYGSNVQIVINSGTIANNGADKNGGAIFVKGEGTLTIGGTTSIPAGEGAIKQSIAYSAAYPIKIADTLKNVTKDSIYLIPGYETNSSGIRLGYSSYKPLITLTDEASTADITIDDIKEKFIIEPFTDPLTGIVTNWTIGSDGKVAKCIENLTVSATGTYQSIADAVAVMNDSTKDYVITLQGEITGPQVIEDPEGGKIKANTIKIIGTSDSSSISSIINANLTESSTKASALTINTTVPVYLRQIIIKGGHGNVIGEGENERIAGGGLFIGEGATVSFENFSKITENTNYIEGSSISGAGAGVYISKDAKFVMNYKTEVCNNTGTHYGAGIYVANGGYMKTIAGSGSDIYGNGFETNFRDNTDKPVITMGGGIYLENGATLEQLGTFIRNNPINEGELGSGIYMCSTANYMISGSAQTNLPNDVYMEKDAQIEVIGSLGVEGKPNARLTLASDYYPTDESNVYPVRLAAGLTWNNSSIASCFEITPNVVDGQKQYWILDKTNQGKLIKQTGMGYSVSIPTGTYNDIEVTVTSDGVFVENNTHLTGKTALVFTASEGFDSYEWSIDNNIQEVETSNILTINTSDWVTGNYVVYLEAIKDNKHYSYTAQIKVSAN